jgi:hypothetical protein
MRTGQLDILAEQLRMDGVARFRDGFNRFECLFFTDQEVLKIYRPQSVRKIGGRSTDRLLMGDVGFVLRSELISSGSAKWLSLPASLSLVPIMNFPGSISLSTLHSVGGIEPGYVDELHSFMCKLPATCVEISRRFGETFFSLSRLERLMIMARELRETSG